MVRSLRLGWDAWNEDHVARHGINPDEVEEAARNAPHMIRARGRTFRVIGQTDGGRSLTVFVAPRPGGTFYVVTARDADEIVRRAYQQRDGTVMTKVPKSPSRIPVFTSIEEEAEFWDTHDSTEFEDEWEPVEVELPLEVTSTFFLEVEFDRATWDRLRDFARERRVDRSDLARQWVMEGFARAQAEAEAAAQAQAPRAG